MKSILDKVGFIPASAALCMIAISVVAGCDSVAYGGDCVQQINGHCAGQLQVVQPYAVQQFNVGHHQQQVVVQRFVQPQRVIVRQQVVQPQKVIIRQQVVQQHHQQQAVVVEKIQVQKQQRVRLNFRGRIHHSR